MNALLLILIAVPTIEIFLLIKIGQNIGALSTISLIFFTAIIGIYFAKIEGLNTLRSRFLIYTKIKYLFEGISGASIAFAALLCTGFFTDSSFYYTANY